MLDILISKVSTVGFEDVRVTLPGSILELVEEEDLQRNIDKKSLSCTVRKPHIKWRANDFREMFLQNPTAEIIQHLEVLCQCIDMSKSDIILLNGQFAESKFLENEVRKHFPDIRIVVPLDPSTAIGRGAVYFRHFYPK